MAKGKGGRPRKHDHGKLMAQVCERISQGALVKDAAEEFDTSAKNVRALGLTPEFSALYARAREMQAHAMAEQCVAIADGEDALTLFYEQAIDEVEEEMDEAPKENPHRHKIIAALRANLLNRDKMRMDVRKWLTSKIAPPHYGDKLELGGANGGPVVVNVVYSHE